MDALSDMNIMYNDALLAMSRLRDENDKLHSDIEDGKKLQGILHERYYSCVQENGKLRVELESLRICMAQERLNQKRLNNENKKLRAELDEMERKLLKHDLEKVDSLLELQMDMETLSKHLEEKDNEIQDMASVNENLLLKEHTATAKLAEAHKEIFELYTKWHELQGKLDMLSKQLEDRTDEIQHMEYLNQTLLDKERINNLELNEARKKLIKLDILSKELEDKADEVQHMEYLNQALLVKERMDNQELQRARKELIKRDSLSKQLEDKADEMQQMEYLNQTLLVKERINNQELQEARKELINEHINIQELHEARKELINGLVDFLSHRSNIGIKRMGELDQKPFRDVCMKKFSGEDWSMKSLELCSYWQGNINNSCWYPFKKIQGDDTFQEAIDDNDEMLKLLKDAWGDQVYNAVSVALLEINEYNPSGRYAVPELWNFKEGKKASLKEVVQHLIKQLRVLKSLTKNLKRRG